MGDIVSNTLGDTSRINFSSPITYLFSYLGEKYFTSGSALGAQDWFTGLSWENPELVFNVPCQYNFMDTKTG